MQSKPVASRKDTLVTWAIAVTALAPFVSGILHATPYGPSLDTPRFAGLMISAVVWTWVWALRWFPKAPGFVGRACAALALVIVASAALAEHPIQALTFGEEESLMGAPAWLALLGVFWMASRVGSSAQTHRALRLVFLGALPSATWAATEILSEGQARGSFGNANYYGPVALLLVPLALVEYHRATRPAHRVGWAIATAMLVFTTAVSASLAVTLGLLAEVAIAVLFVPRLLGIDKDLYRRRARLALLGASILLLAWVGLAVGTDVLPSGPLSAPAVVAERNTTRTRLAMLEESVSIWREDPVLGVGPDGFRLASQPYLTEERVRREAGRGRDAFALTRDPHSLPFLLLASFGAVGLAVAGVTLAGWLLCLKRRLRSPAGLVSGAYGLGAAGFLVALLAVPWPARFAALPPLLAGLAIAGADESAPSTPPDSRSRLRALRIAAAVPLTVFALTLAFSSLAGDYALSRIHSSTSFQEASGWADRAMVVQPLRPGLEYERLLVLGQGVRDGRVSREEFVRAVDEASSAVRDNSGYLAAIAQVSLDSARLQHTTDITWESSLVDTASTLCPSHPEVVLARTYEALVAGDLTAARSRLDLASDLGIALPRLVLYEHYMAIELGDAARAAEFAQQIRSQSPWLSGLLLSPR